MFPAIRRSHDPAPARWRRRDRGIEQGTAARRGKHADDDGGACAHRRRYARRSSPTHAVPRIERITPPGPGGARAIIYPRPPGHRGARAVMDIIIRKHGSAHKGIEVSIRGCASACAVIDVCERAPRGASVITALTRPPAVGRAIVASVSGRAGASARFPSTARLERPRRRL